LTLSELFRVTRGAVVEIDSETVDRAVVEALALDVGKLARLQALVLTAPQPWTTGLPSRLFDVLWHEDRNLAVEAILASFPCGAQVHRFLLNRLQRVRDLELLRQATGIVAAGIKEDCDSDLFAEGTFSAIPRFTHVAITLQRLAHSRHREYEIPEFVTAVKQHVHATPGLEHVPKMMLSRLDQALDAAVPIARGAHRPRPSSPTAPVRRPAPS
jgi:hypothetical protein